MGAAGRRGGSILVVALLFLASCSVLLLRAEDQLIEFTDRHRFSNAHWGILVRSLENGRVLWAKDERLHFNPASNLKLFTTAVSLLRLGPNYRYTTQIFARGRIRDSVLYGDLIVRASGDPSLSGRFRSAGAIGVFEEWAGALVNKGIRNVQGDIVIDDSLFDTQRLGSGWFWDDEAFSYSAQISAFSIYDNCVEVKVSAGPKGGDPGIVEVMPRTSYVLIVNRTQTEETGKSSITISRQPGSNVITISGTVSFLDVPKEFVITVHEPAYYGATVLKEVLESKGISVHGRLRTAAENEEPPDVQGRLIVSTTSPPLSVIIRHINKPSHNLSAELLFRTLGAVYYGKGTTDNGSKVLVETLERAGIIPEEIHFRDGSGLSRLSMVTPRQIVNLLELMYHHPAFAFFYNSLPVGGVDGTLATRMIGTCAEDNVRAKTGSATHISCLSGYIRKMDGEMLAFSILTNNNPLIPLEIRKLQDSFCVWLCDQ